MSSTILGYFPPTPGLGPDGLLQHSLKPQVTETGMECGYQIIKWGWGQLVDKAHNPQVPGGFWVKGRLTFYYRCFFASGCVPQGGSWVFNDSCGLERGLLGGLYLLSVFKYSPVKETILIGRADKDGVSRADPSVTHWHRVC